MHCENTTSQHSFFSSSCHQDNLGLERVKNMCHVTSPCSICLETPLIFQQQSHFMPIDRQRYPKNWKQIALSVKEAASWRCQHCQRLCLRPGEKPASLTRSEWTVATLSVHHANFTPEDNTKSNLLALCTPCHLSLHSRANKRSNVSPGQLSLW